LNAGVGTGTQRFNLISYFKGKQMMNVETQEFYSNRTLKKFESWIDENIGVEYDRCYREVPTSLTIFDVTPREFEMIQKKEEELLCKQEQKNN
jgi:hypothetical protein